jgi:hypothetical protein
VKTIFLPRALLSSGWAVWKNIIEAIGDCVRFFGACIAHHPVIAYVSRLVVKDIGFLSCFRVEPDV